MCDCNWTGVQLRFQDFSMYALINFELSSGVDHNFRPVIKPKNDSKIKLAFSVTFGLCTNKCANLTTVLAM